MPFRTSTVVTASLLVLGVGGALAVFGDTIRAALAPPAVEVGARQLPAAGAAPNMADQTSSPPTGPDAADAGPGRAHAGVDAAR